MKRLHVHVSVGDFDASLRFYSQRFAADPIVRKADYAKWMLEDPRVNFAISQHEGRPGVQHLGIEVENRAELAEVYERLRHAEGPVIEQGGTTCCYAHSEKSWIEDPQGVQWETFLRISQRAEYGTDEIRPKGTKPAATACCAPRCCSSSAP